MTPKYCLFTPPCSGKRSMLRGLFFAADKGCLYFVCISGALFGRVFRGQKISGLLFKISGSDFKIRATNFFLSPTRVKSAENQFSFFRVSGNAFSRPYFLVFYVCIRATPRRLRKRPRRRAICHVDAAKAAFSLIKVHIWGAITFFSSKKGLRAKNVFFNDVSLRRN